MRIVLRTVILLGALAIPASAMADVTFNNDVQPILEKHCQMCHRPHRLLNVAHLSADPADRTTLTVLCPSCHSRRNAAHRNAITRRTRARKRGQMWLTDELEVAPTPVRLWPMRLRQMDLF